MTLHKSFEIDTGEYDRQRFIKPLGEIKRVCELRDLLLDSVAPSILNSALSYVDIETFAVDAEVALGWDRGAKAIQATVQPHLGEALGIDGWRKVCWQIAANETYIKRGVSLSPDVTMYNDRWMVVDIIGVKMSPASGAYARLTFRALTGAAAGWSMSQDAPLSQISYLAYRFGFKGREYQPWYQFDDDPIRLYGLYFVASVSDLKVTRFACEDQLYDTNRKIIRMRYREEGEEDGQAFDQWGEPVDASKRIWGCPAQRPYECWNCDCKRHVVKRPLDLRIDGSGATCAAAYLI